VSYLARLDAIDPEIQSLQAFGEVVWVPAVPKDQGNSDGPCVLTDLQAFARSPLVPQNCRPRTVRRAVLRPEWATSELNLSRTPRPVLHRVAYRTATDERLPSVEDATFSPACPFAPLERCGAWD
jgi:hypothetical protein